MMSRLPVVDPADGDPAQRDALAEWQLDRGQSRTPGVLWRMLVASPSSMRSIGKLGAFVRVGTTLDPVVQEAGALMASALRGFRFEIDIHEEKLRAVGVEPEEVYRAGRGEHNDLPEAVQATAAMASVMARGDEADDAQVTLLREVLGDEQFVEVLTVIAYFLMIGDLAKVLHPDD